MDCFVPGRIVSTSLTGRFLASTEQVLGRTFSVVLESVRLFFAFKPIFAVFCGDRLFVSVRKEKISVFLFGMRQISIEVAN